MGLCHDFGSQIAEGCDHPIRAGSDSCTCERCGVVCKGRFEACPAVWARGPHPVLRAPKAQSTEMAPAPPRARHEGNGHDGPGGAAAPAVALPAPGAAPRLPEVVGASPTPTDERRSVEALRREVDGLRGALAQEQALVATLVTSGRTDAGPDAEALRALVDGAVRAAVRREAVALGDTVAAILEGVRRELETLRQANEANFAAFHESVEQVAALPTAVREASEENVDVLKASVAQVAAVGEALPDAVREANEASLAALKESVDEMVDVTTNLPAELSRHDAGNRKAFRTTLGQELQPLIEVVADSIAQSDYELKSIGAKLDALAQSNSALATDLAEVIAQVGELVWTEEIVEEPAPPPRALPLARRTAAPPNPPTKGAKVSLRESRR